MVALFSGVVSAFRGTRLVEPGSYVGAGTLLRIATYLTCLRRPIGRTPA